MVNNLPVRDGVSPHLFWKFAFGSGLLLAGTTLLLQTWTLPPHVNQLRDLGRIAGYETSAATRFTLAILLLFGGYLLALWSCMGRSTIPTAPVVVLATGLLFFGFAMLYPATANDVYLYIVRARLWTEYGVDPSAVTPMAVMRNDPFAHFMNRQWAIRHSPYGPLWNWIAIPGAWLANSGMMAAILWFKILAAGALLGCTWSLHAIVRNIDARLAMPAAIALLWNPLVLWEGIGNGHNDLLALWPLLLALQCWQSRRHHAVIPLIVTSMLIKYTAAPLFPLVVIALWRSTPGVRERIALILRSGSVAVAVAVISLVPFFHIVELWQAFSEQRSVVVTSIPLVVYLATHEIGYDTNLHVITTLSTICVAVASVAGCTIVWRDPRFLLRSCYWVMFVLLLLGTPNLRPWYVVWLLPLALMSAAPIHWMPALVWSFSGVLSYAYYIWIRDWWHVSGFVFETTGVAITLLPVIATQCVVTWRQRARENRR